MMDPREAYDQWSSIYDTNENKTRDLEAKALREILSPISFHHCLEIGCGTGKNTVWLQERAKTITAIDLSDEMMAKAREKVDHSKVEFFQADINLEWDFVKRSYDLAVFSLVLEHIKDLEAVFGKVAKTLSSGGHLYIGELHPFKQYLGSKATFQTETGKQTVACYQHHISEYLTLSRKHNFELREFREYFDNDLPGEPPRILALLFKKV